MVNEKNIRKKYIELGKAEIVGAAKELFLQKSIESVTVEEIAESAGVGAATVYRYFGAKKRIVIEAGIRLWREVKEETDAVFSSDEYIGADGIGRIGMILNMYSSIYLNKRGFLLFLDDFDGFCISEKIGKDELKELEDAIADFYVPYVEAIKKGKEDGTVRAIADERLLYLTVSHTMLALLKKMAQGEILTQDGEYGAELAIIKEIILNYFKK